MKKRVSKAIVTGGAGFIGSHIVDSLIERSIETYVIDNLTTGTLDNLAQHFDSEFLHIVIGNITDIHDLMPNIEDVDVLFHQAAIASIVASIKDPLFVNDVNLTSTLKVMNYCIEHGIKRFVFASSGAVYGTVGNQRFSEDMICRPDNPYGASKLGCENYLHAYHSIYGLETVMLRYFNVYGERQTYSESSGVITSFINKLLRNEAPIIYGDGLQTRDFVHVSDIVQANLLSAEENDIASKSFNIASGRSHSINEILHIIKQVSHTEHIQHKYAPAREGDQGERFQASIKNAIDNLGYIPKMSLHEGLKRVVDFTRNKNNNNTSDKKILLEQFNQAKSRQMQNCS
jgi:nucleoside-diphosphate-sugar epimerase